MNINNEILNLYKNYSTQLQSFIKFINVTKRLQLYSALVELVSRRVRCRLMWSDMGCDPARCSP
jgi:hypothetical protein